MNPEEILLPDPMEIPVEFIAPMISRLAGIQTILAMRLQNESVSSKPSAESEGSDEFLTTAEAAKLLKVSDDWIYRRANRLPFSKRLSRKALRFSKAGLLRWRASRMG